MRLYVLDSENQQVELGYDARSRKELAKLIGSPYFKYKEKTYSVSDVQAEASVKSVVPAAVGAAVGMFGGGIGLAIGGTIGALVGESLAKEDKDKADSFNASRVEQA